MKVRVILVDNHQIVSEGLQLLLTKESDLEVVGKAINGYHAIKLADELKPDVVVMAIDLPEMNGIEATHKIVSMVPAPKVLCLSIHSDPRIIARMMHAGAMGYISKECAYDELARGIRAVVGNQVYFSPAIEHTIPERYIQQLAKDDTAIVSILTDREREVLQLIAEGNSTKEIAEILFISAKTVESHRAHIMEKLHAKGVVELTKIALSEGLTTLDN